MNDWLPWPAAELRALIERDPAATARLLRDVGAAPADALAQVFDAVCPRREDEMTDDEPIDYEPLRRAAWNVRNAWADSMRRHWSARYHRECVRQMRRLHAVLLELEAERDGLLCSPEAWKNSFKED